MAAQVPRWLPQWAQAETRNRKGLIACVLAASAIGLTLFSLFGKSQYPNVGWNGTYTPDWRLDIVGQTAAVASDVPECSRMGLEVLKAGGSAADAAVQVCLCIGTMAPQSSGIGGGGFITVRYPNGSSLVIDARESAPMAAHKHMFDEDPLRAKWFGLASGVPGEVAGLEALWQTAGRMPWEDLVNPVADLNEFGFSRGEALANITELFTKQLDQLYPGHLDRMVERSDWCWIFENHPHCRGQSPGSLRNTEPSSRPVLKRPQLANTLRDIAKNGARAFYEGPIAKHLVNITQRLGGILTLEDMANYSVVVRPTLTARFMNRTLLTAPEPASGPALVMGLHAIENLIPESTDLRELDTDPVFLQRLVEVMKWMAAARSELGDPAFISNPRIAEMLRPQWARQVAGNVSDEHTLPSWRDYHPSFEINNPAGTSHFSVLDKDGMAVAMTTTVNLPFGNGICDPATGIIMNSEMDDFSIPYQKNSFELAPSIYNFVAPGKRPLSSTVPSVFVNENNEVDMVIGAAGGSRILTTVFHAIVRAYVADLEPLELVSFPRFHHQLIPEVLMTEPGIADDLLSAWSDKGHTLEMRPPASTMNLIQRDYEGLHAVGDFYRKRGLGAAY